MAQNDQPVIDAINRVKSQKQSTLTSNYDFSTLYTDIPHNKQSKKNKQNKTKTKTKKNWGNLLISVSKLLKFGATWINDKSKFKTTFNEVSLKLAINFLLDN